MNRCFNKSSDMEINIRGRLEQSVFIVCNRPQIIPWKEKVKKYCWTNWYWWEEKWVRSPCRSIRSRGVIQRQWEVATPAAGKDGLAGNAVTGSDYEGINFPAWTLITGRSSSSSVQCRGSLESSPLKPFAALPWNLIQSPWPISWKRNTSWFQATSSMNTWVNWVSTLQFIVKISHL